MLASFPRSLQSSIASSSPSSSCRATTTLCPFLLPSFACHATFNWWPIQVRKHKRSIRAFTVATTAPQSARFPPPPPSSPQGEAYEYPLPKDHYPPYQHQFQHNRLPPPLPYGDTLPAAKFRDYFGFAVPSSPDRWLRALWEGAFLPYKNPNPDIDRLLVFLEASHGDGFDVITELVVRGRWEEAVWIVRALLEPRGSGYRGSDEGADVLEGVVYTALGGGKLKPKIRKGEGRHVAGIAGKSGLWAVPREIKRDVERRRRGLGAVLGGLGVMILRAGGAKERGGQEERGGKEGQNGEGGERQKEPEEGSIQIPNGYTDCLPTARQILAYIHTSGLVPLSVYSSGQYPRLHFHRSKIMASMADAVWRAQEAFVAWEAEQLGVSGKHRGMEVPHSRVRLVTWGSGTKDTPDRPTPAEASTNEGARGVEFGAYAEREIWMELVMALVNEGGYGLVGTFLLERLLSQGWNFANYAVLRPSEYDPEYIRRARIDEKEGVVAQWGLEGYSLARPHIHTLPLTLPDWVIPGVINSLVNSNAESRGVERLLERVITIAKITPRHLLRRSALARVLRSPEVLAAKSPQYTFAVAKIEGFLGNSLMQQELLYTTLEQAIDKDNLHTARDTWKSIVKLTKSVCHPEWVVGKYLMALVRRRQLAAAERLLTASHRGEVSIPVSSYHHPSIAPGLLALAITTGSTGLLGKAAAAIRESGGTHAMFSSLLNAYLRFGKIELAQGVLVFMKDHGVDPDATDVGLLVENELRRDPEAGYRLVEAACGNKPPKHLPKHLSPKNRPGFYDPPEESSTANPRPSPESNAIPEVPGVKPCIGISRDAWLSVLYFSIRANSPQRTYWALSNLLVDLPSSQGMDSVIFNMLLSRAVQRRGAYTGMLLCKRYWIDAQPGGNTEDGRGNLISLRTVLHQAIREMESFDRDGLYAALKNKSPEELEGKLKEQWEKKEKVVKALWWCWKEMRRLGASVREVEGDMWGNVAPVRVER